MSGWLETWSENGLDVFNVVGPGGFYCRACIERYMGEAN